MFSVCIIKKVDALLIISKSNNLNCGHFFCYIKLDFPYTLISHNSDMPVDENILVDDKSIFHWLENPLIKKWYTQNVCCDHPKIHSIPIGIGNPSSS